MPEEAAVLPDAGASDLAAAAAALRSRLPEPLAALAEIAYNYRWSWTPGGPELFASVDAQRWEPCAANPVRLLQEVHPERLAELAADDAFLERAGRARGGASTPSARGAIPPPASRPSTPAAFFCAEYAVHGSLPVYSGGLGVLAGDILKEASDRRLPLVAVGLMYRHGYFRQRIDASGWQHEYWVDTDPDRVPARARHRRGRRAAHGHGPASATARSSRRSGGSTSAASRCCCSTPTGRRTTSPTAGSPRACTSATPTCA